MTGIVRTDTVLGGDPRIDGTRVGVLHVHELVVDGGHSPADAADQLDLSLADVYAALAYYHDNPETMREVRRRHTAVAEKLAESSLEPPGVQH